MMASLKNVAYALWRPFLGLCMLTGFVVLVIPPSCRAMPLLYVDTNYQKIKNTSGELAAFRRVTKGGLGTVWTTRIFVRDMRTAKESLIYQSKDSDFVPTILWSADETLEIGLPCDRSDFLANPADYNEGRTSFERFAVRFRYVSDCKRTSDIAA